MTSLSAKIAFVGLAMALLNPSPAKAQGGCMMKDGVFESLRAAGFDQKFHALLPETEDKRTREFIIMAKPKSSWVAFIVIDGLVACARNAGEIWRLTKGA